MRGAMLAFLELYFARFVVLVEGDSRAHCAPRLAGALDLLVDPAFVAIVPLGGRHVQHFWRLLADLGIPLRPSSTSISAERRWFWPGEDGDRKPDRSRR